MCLLSHGFPAAPRDWILEAPTPEKSFNFFLFFFNPFDDERMTGRIYDEYCPTAFHAHGVLVQRP